MHAAGPRPVIGITACLKERDESFFHSVQRKYVDAVTLAADAIPLLIPAIGDRQDVEGVLDRVDGVMLTGSPSNVGPQYYGGPPAREGNIADPDRDATTLPLIRAAYHRRLPLIAICRGIQELNVALGGSLHQHVQEVPGRLDHRSDKSKPRERRYDPVHGIELIAGGVLDRLFGGASAIMVNSLHGQGIDRLAEPLAVEARATDGTIEAVSLRDGQGFAIGVQWHPEYAPLADPWSQLLFASFGDAARAFAATRVTHAGFSRVA